MSKQSMTYSYLENSILGVVNRLHNGVRQEQGSMKHVWNWDVAAAKIIVSMSFLHLFIVNKSGGLIHHRALSPKAPKIGTNEWLRIASTFHSLHAIAAEASPIRCLNGKNFCE